MHNDGITPRFLGTRAAARYLSISVAWLKLLRCQRGKGPAFSRVSSQVVLYDRADLDAWVVEHRNEAVK